MKPVASPHTMVGVMTEIMRDAEHQRANDIELRRVPPRSLSEARRRIRMAREEIARMSAFIAAAQR